jgi:hypothetical protein
MLRPLQVLVLAAAAASAAAQDPPTERAVDPVQLVSRAEPMFGKGQVEDAILQLWRALEELRSLPANPVHEVTAMTARYLLLQHDPLDAERRRVVASIARQQIDLAQAYRGRKWFDTATTRLDVAERYDPDQTAKPREALATARSKAAPRAAPTPQPAAPEAKPPSLLQRASTLHVFGDWKEADASLTSKAQSSTDPLAMWVTKSTHADNEIVVEWRPLEPAASHHCAILFGGFVGATVEGHRAECIYDAKAKAYCLRLVPAQIDQPELGATWVTPPPSADGLHRLSLQIRDRQLRLCLDDTSALEATSAEPVRGLVGLCIGLKNIPTCALEFRSFRVAPLPADLPSDEDLREQRIAAVQQSIAGAVDAAKALQEKKQPEPASLLLRQALADLEELPAGLLRDNLAKALEQMLMQTDPLAARRKKTAQGIAAELVALADQYAKAGMARAAGELVTEAGGFDRDGTAARQTAAVEAVRAWNLAQATARVAELAPPTDDGTVLREWFATGRVLDSRTRGWVVEGPTVRTEPMAAHDLTALMPKAGMPALSKARAHVRLPAAGTDAGFCFDVAGPHDYAITFLTRDQHGLGLMAYRWASGKWTELKRVKIKLDAWRLDGWFPIELEMTPKGLTVRGAGAELQLTPNLLPNQTGRFGLYAGSSTGEPATIELRAFQIGP